MANIIDIVVRAKDSTAGAFKKVSASAEKLKAGLAKGFGGAAKAAKGLAVAVALVGTAVIAAAKNFIGFGSAAEEISTKFDAVFASSKTAADAIANDLAASFDLADSTAKEMLANIGDLLTGFGFTGAEALEMADKVSRLGIDLASFTNYSKGASGATEALTKLLLGESEQAKSLGIVVRQGSDEYKNAVKAKQADLGVSLLQAKAMTALEMAVNQSNNAIGDYARTQEGVANRQRKANEAFKQAKEDIGLAIIAHSSYGDILNMVAEKTKELTESGLIELWAENVAKAVEWLIPIVEKLGRGCLSKSKEKTKKDLTAYLKRKRQRKKRLQKKTGERKPTRWLRKKQTVQLKNNTTPKRKQPILRQRPQIMQRNKTSKISKTTKNCCKYKKI